MAFNFIDIIIFVFFVYFFWQGYHVGFVGGVLNILSTVVSFSAAILFYPMVGGWVDTTFGWGENLSLVVAFFVLFILIEIFLTVASNRLLMLISPFYSGIKSFAKIDKIFGVAPSVFMGLFLVSLFLLLPLILPVGGNVRDPIQNSWWGKNVLKEFLRYQPELEKVLSRVPYKNLAYLITPGPLSKNTVQLNFPKEIKLLPDPNAEKEMFDLVNKERTEKGIKALTWREDLLETSRKHCLDMFSRGYFSHYTPEGKSPFDRMDEDGVKYRSAGENLAYAPNVEVAHQGLMNSPGHKENILRKEFGRIAVGVIDGGINGKMFCQEFTD